MDEICATIEEESFKELGDDEILSLIKKGDASAQDYLLHKYKSLVRFKVRSYFLIGSDRDDLIQEGMVGLFKAIRDFEPGKGTPFFSFAELCITRQIFTAIKTATRQKHAPLNSYISLNKPIFEQESFNQTYMDNLPTAKESNPETMLIEREDRDYMEAKMTESFSILEMRVLNLYLQGLSYIEIAEITKKSIKSVDNALQRIKKKIEKFKLEKNNYSQLQTKK